MTFGSVPTPDFAAGVPPSVGSTGIGRRALARLLSRVERGEADAELAALYPRTGQAHIVGITGPPGAGKSTLIAAVARELRTRGRTVAIVAVDPSSPFSGGAILGDRIRMQGLSGDVGIFVRSMATRGALGGLAPHTQDMARVLDAAGFDTVLIETVGAGQSEIDIVRAAQTVVVVEAPGMGDDIQAIKAGILEIADILVLNKADQPGADAAHRALRAMLDLGHQPDRGGHHRPGQGAAAYVLVGHSPASESGDRSTPEDPSAASPTAWEVPLLQTVGQQGTGVSGLVDTLYAHRSYLQSSGSGRAREAEQLEAELAERLRSALLARLLADADHTELQRLIDKVVDREISPGFAVKSLIHQFALPHSAGHRQPAPDNSSSPLTFDEG